MMPVDSKDGRKPPAQQKGADALWTPANVVTLVRICLVPVFVVAIISPWPAYFGLDSASGVKSWVAAAIFIVLAATDGLDGYLARSRGEVTDFGKFMDPLADKILVAAALLSLIELGVLPSWPALIILTREFIVSGIRMVAASKGTVIAASWYGKAKTVTQIIAIVLFIVKDSIVKVDPAGALHDPLYLVSWAAMIAAVILTIVSMLDYFVKARHLLGFGGGSRDGGAACPDAGQPAEADPACADEAANGAADTLDAALLDEAIARRAKEVVERAAASSRTVGTAESLTGGMIACALTSVPGSSAVVRGGIVSYVNEVKRDALGVPAEVLSSDGAVSERTACAMAQGACERLVCDIAVSVTGIAGPGGAEPGKPVGTVWMGSCRKGAAPAARLLNLPGDRDEVRRRTVLAALSALLEGIDSL